MAYILVVDDDRDVAGEVERALRRKDHEVAVAYSGVQALQLIQNQLPDLVILDIMMPRMDGIEVCRRLRADPSTDDIPILFLSAKSKLEDKIEGFEVGGDDYLTKPFDLRELEMRVKAVLRRSLWGRIGGTKEMPRAFEADSFLDPRTYEVQINEKKVPLTAGGFELLYYLVQHAGEVVSTERLLQEVWEYPPDTGDPNLVRAHIKDIRAKIEPSPDNPTYIRTISRHGYIWTGESMPPQKPMLWAKSDFRIFLCHAREDKPHVHKLYRKLKRAGYSPWLDEKDIPPGRDWEHEIRRAIRRANLFLACLSSKSVYQRGYMQKELTQALDVLDEIPQGDVYLIPVRLEECDVPDRLRKRQWVDLFARGGFKRLVQAIELARVIQTESS